MTRTILVCAVLVGLVCMTQAAESIDLDVTRVSIFSSGVAHFQCDTKVAGDADAELNFRTEQINDILKSMVVQDFGGGQVGMIRYASRDPIEKTLQSFGIDLTDNPSLAELLVQLRGEPVVLVYTSETRGTIVGVEKTPIYNDDGKQITERVFLTVLTDEGLQRIDIAKVYQIRLVNEKINAEFQKALAVLASGHHADKKSVAVRFRGNGERHVRVSYLLEAPIWKTSYRLVLDDETPLIQGWATVDNATEEDWDNVRLSLISGRPISFRMDLYTPLYVPRPMEQLDLYASLRPPEYAAGFEGEELRRRPGSAPRRGAKMMAPSARGRGDVQADANFAGGRPLSFGVAEEGRMAFGSLDAGVQSVAAAKDAGELFAYHIDAPVSIPRQQSAMLPIINESVDAKKLSIFNRQTHEKHPVNGLELTNSTDLHLMQGPVTVFDGGTYAGDAKLPDINPGEKRLLAYALDLSTEVIVKQKPTPDEIVSVRIIKGTLWHRHKHVDEKTYMVKNTADKPKTVLLEQPYNDAWTLVEPKEPHERTQNLLRFKVQAPAGETVNETVVLERITDQSIALSNIGLDQIRYYLKMPVMTAEIRDALERVIQLRRELDQAEQTVARLEEDREEEVADQERIRENLRTLDRNTEAYQRQLKNFDAVDKRIADLRRQIDQGRDTEAQKRRALDEYMSNLTLEP